MDKDPRSVDWIKEELLEGLLNDRDDDKRAPARKQRSQTSNQRPHFSEMLPSN